MVCQLIHGLLQLSRITGIATANETVNALVMAADMPEMGRVSGFSLTYTISWVCEMP
jgi:hypothetical protein